MAVPTTMADLSVTAASNSPAGTDVIGASADDFLRAIEAILREVGGTLYTAGGTANALTITTVPAITAYYSGLRLKVKAAATNTGAVTINVNSLGTKNIVSYKGDLCIGGELISDAVLDLLYDGTQFRHLGALSASPKAAAYRSSTQSISTSTWTQVQQNAEEFDVGGYMETSGSYRYFPGAAGKYLISAQVAYQAASGNASLYIAIYKNGSLHRFHNAGRADASVARAVSLCCAVEANGSSDYFQLYTFQDQGGSMTVDSGSDRTFFHVAYLGA